MTDFAHSFRVTIGDAAIIRKVTDADLASIVALDEKVAKIAKPDYWLGIFEGYATWRLNERFFLAAEAQEYKPDLQILGYFVGEIRGWEFGSEPCGWIFAFSVGPGTREQGVGENLLEAISHNFRAAGVRTMRTMVARQNQTLLCILEQTLRSEPIKKVD
ncbi:MAG: GNAT family N-acetyltransferase [Hyphomicrobiales bacterium]|nr:GNAT family N-acetyltransferase [Hyphomicrobiales bacterium]